MSNGTIQLINHSHIDDLSNSINTLSQNIKSADSNITTISTLSNSGNGHNGIYRGKNLTNIYTIDEICEMVSDGTFEDLYIGDYITVTINSNYTSNEEVDIVFADFNTFLKSPTDTSSSNTLLSQNHITCVTRDCFKAFAPINNASQQGNSFYVSDMYNSTLLVYRVALLGKFNDHMLTRYTFLCNNGGFNTSLASDAGAGYIGGSNNYVLSSSYKIQIYLMNELQLYGNTIMSSNRLGDSLTGFKQFSLFQLAPEYIIAHQGKDGDICSYWLSAVTANYKNACCDAGIASCADATTALGVRPYFLLG